MLDWSVVNLPNLLTVLNHESPHFKQYVFFLTKKCFSPKGKKTSKQIGKKKQKHLLPASQDQIQVFSSCFGQSAVVLGELMRQCQNLQVDALGRWAVGTNISTSLGTIFGSCHMDMPHYRMCIHVCACLTTHVHTSKIPRVPTKKKHSGDG